MYCFYYHFCEKNIGTSDTQKDQRVHYSVVACNGDFHCVVKH